MCPHIHTFLYARSHCLKQAVRPAAATVCRRPCKWWPRANILEVIAHVSASLRAPSVYQFEVRKPYRSKDMTDFRSYHLSVWWPWPLTLVPILVLIIRRGTDNRHSWHFFYVFTTFRCRVMVKHASNWRHTLSPWPLTFEVTVHVADARYRIPSVRQIWIS